MRKLSVGYWIEAHRVEVGDDDVMPGRLKRCGGFARHRAVEAGRLMVCVNDEDAQFRAPQAIGRIAMVDVALQNVAMEVAAVKKSSLSAPLPLRTDVVRPPRHVSRVPNASKPLGGCDKTPTRRTD